MKKLTFIDDFVDFNDPATQAMMRLFDKRVRKIKKQKNCFMPAKSLMSIFDRDNEKLLTYEVVDKDGFMISMFCAKNLKEAKAVVKKEYPKKNYKVAKA